MPSKAAACCSVSFRSVSSCEMRMARSAFASSSSEFGKPKSAKTFPLLGSTSGLFFAFFLPSNPFRILFLRELQPFLDEFDFVLRRLDTLLGFLLEGMEHEDCLRKADRIDSSV